MIFNAKELMSIKYVQNAIKNFQIEVSFKIILNVLCANSIIASYTEIYKVDLIYKLKICVRKEED